MEHVPKNLVTPEEIKEHEKTTLKRKISLVVGRFHQLYFNSLKEEKRDKVEQTYGIKDDDINADMDVSGYLKEKLGDLLKKQGINVEELKIEVKSEIDEHGEKGKETLYGVTDIKIYNKENNELLHDSEIGDIYPFYEPEDNL